ncbi:MAG: hypothetical protein M1817_000082 [Caeruleum heppii]|nr:MAG: hypothetical protein M1817_000082 [Caeruleum heppii]
MPDPIRGLNDHSTSAAIQPEPKLSSPEMRQRSRRQSFEDEEESGKNGRRHRNGLDKNFMGPPTSAHFPAAADTSSGKTCTHVTSNDTRPRDLSSSGRTPSKRQVVGNAYSQRPVSEISQEPTQFAGSPVASGFPGSEAEMAPYSFPQHARATASVSAQPIGSISQVSSPLAPTTSYTFPGLGDASSTVSTNESSTTWFFNNGYSDRDITGIDDGMGGADGHHDFRHPAQVGVVGGQAAGADGRDCQPVFENEKAPVIKHKEQVLEGDREDDAHVLSLRLLQRYNLSY